MGEKLEYSIMRKIGDIVGGMVLGVGEKMRWEVCVWGRE